MSAENLVLQESENQVVDNSEKFREEHDRLVGYCVENYDLGTMQELFSFLELDKGLAKYIEDFRNGNTQMLKARIIQNESQEKQSKITTLSLEEAQKYINNGQIEIEKREGQLNEKILQLALISDIAGMYKEYLRSILENIRFKAFSFKDEKYEAQIDLIETEIKEVSNMIGYLNLVGNSDELLEINAKELTKKLIVSEGKILNSGFFTSEYLEFGSFLNSGVNSINEAISKSNLKVENIKGIRLDIFEKMRKIDLIDTDRYQYNSGEAIRNRLTGNILTNEDLNSNEFIKGGFDLIKNISENDKQRLYSELNNGKESFFKFCESINLFETFGTKGENFKKILSSRIFKALSDGMESLDTPKLEDFIKNEVGNRINYLEKQLENSDNKEEIKKEIERLKSNIEGTKLDKQIEEIKVETAFKSFEKFIINHTLVRQTKAVEEFSKDNKDVALYSNIEGIGFGLSDEDSNLVVSFTQTLAEQIALMAVSGLIGNVALKAFGAGETINLLNGGRNLANIGNIGRNLVVEGGAFYLGYTSLNSIIHKNEWTELLDDFNFYDAVRTMAFLGVLRSFGKTGEALNVKNVSLDTAKLLGTDIAIRGTFGEFIGREGIEGVDFDNLSNSDKEEIALFIAEEIAFIVPLIIGLRLSEKVTSARVSEKVEVELTQGQFNIKFGDLKVEVKELDRLRKFAKKKGQNTDKIDAILREKNGEYKALRDNNPEFVKEFYKKRDEPLQNQSQNNTEPDRGNRSNADEGVNMNTGTPPRYLKAERISKEVQEKGISHTLKDEKLYETIEKTGIGKDGKGVGEAILRKAGFKESEIKDYNNGKLRSEKVEKGYEKKALSAMEKAIDVVVVDREFLRGVLKNKELTRLQKKEVLVKKGFTELELVTRLYSDYAKEKEKKDTN